MKKDLTLRSHPEELRHHKAERKQAEEANKKFFSKCNSNTGNMMGKKSEREVGKHKIWAIAVLLAGACILTYYFHAVLRTCTVFTHFYYIPIILASLWWKRKGLIVAVFLAALLVSSHIVFRPDTAVVNDYFRVLIFIAVAFAIGELSKHIERTQKTLHESEEQFRNLVETTSDWVWQVDRNGVYTYASPRVKELLGYDVEEIIGKTPFDLMPPDEAERVAGMFRAIVESRKPFAGLENTNLHKNGRRVVLETSGVPVLDSNGNLVGYRGIDRDITERQKAEEKLKESEERFRTIFDNAADGMLLADVEGKKFHMGNKAICQMLGYNLGEITKLKVMDIHPEGDLPYVVGQFEKQSRQELTLSRDTPVKRKDGSIFYADINSLPVILGGKKYLMGIFRDITEHRRTEQMLRESGEKFRQVVSTTTDAIMLFDAKTRQFIDVNKACEELYGYSREEFLKLKQCDITTEPEKSEESIRETLKGKLKKIPIRYHRKKNGTIFPVEISASDFELQGRRVLCGVVRDITERMKSEEALRDSENKHRTLLENLPQKIFLKDKNSVYVSCNENYAKDLKIKSGEIAGRTDYEFYPKKLAEKYRADDRSIMESGETKDIEEKYIRDGREVIVHTVKTPVKDQQGNVVGILGIFWDITELKQAQEKLNQYRETMARAEQLASLGTLSATVAHELTQPLTAIRLSIENSLAELEGTSCPNTVTEELEDSLTEVSNAASIVNRFRNFARRSSEEVVSWVDLKATANKIVNLLNESARRAKVTLLVKDMDALPLVYSNEREIEQLFFVLIENAIQAADGKKNRQLTISGIVKDESIELQLSDNCGGIAPENLNKIFEPFFTTKPMGQATGLGLCIVQHIVSRVGGKVRVESKLGKGSTFFITLPVNVDGVL